MGSQPGPLEPGAASQCGLSLWQTYIGSILVSVNPYRLYNIYGKEQVLQYEGRALGENPP